MVGLSRCLSRSTPCPPLFGRFLRQALRLLSSEATKQLPVNPVVCVHSFEAPSKTQQIHAANKAAEHCNPTEPGRGGVNANITLKVEGGYYVNLPSGKMALEELIYSGRIEWEVSISETVYKILRRFGETKPVAGCCLFDWPGKGLTGVMISNANRDLRFLHVPIADRVRKKIFRQQLSLKN